MTLLHQQLELSLIGWASLAPVRSTFLLSGDLEVVCA
jgi:hypothetical protein